RLEAAHWGREYVVIVGRVAPHLLAVDLGALHPFRELRVEGCIRYVPGPDDSIGVVPVVPGSVGPAATGVFPLGFCGKSIDRFLLLAQPLAVGLGVVPTYVDHRMFVRLLEPGRPPIEFGGLAKGSRVVVRVSPPSPA